MPVLTSCVRAGPQTASPLTTTGVCASTVVGPRLDMATAAVLSYVLGPGLSICSNNAACLVVEIRAPTLQQSFLCELERIRRMGLRQRASDHCNEHNQHACPLLRPPRLSDALFAFHPKCTCHLCHNRTARNQQFPSAALLIKMSRWAFNILITHSSVRLRWPPRTMQHRWKSARSTLPERCAMRRSHPWRITGLPTSTWWKYEQACDGSSDCRTSEI